MRRHEGDAIWRTDLLGAVCESPRRGAFMVPRPLFCELLAAVYMADNTTCILTRRRRLWTLHVYWREWYS